MDRREILKGAFEGMLLAATGNAVFAAEDGNQQATSHSSGSIDQSGRVTANNTVGRRTKGDFVPSAATGTDNKSALQQVLNAVSTSGEFPIEPGDYYLGRSSISNIAHLELGNQFGQQIRNIVINAYGVTLYPGATGKVFALMNCDNVIIKGLRIIGYHGGALGKSREHDHAMSTMFSAWNVTFVDCYFSGALGDQLYVGGANTSAAGHESRNIRLIGTTLKCRFGNGIPSYSGGTGSRNALSVIDCIGLEVDSTNLLMGNVDFEPNGNGQHIVDCHINTRFSNGNVIADSNIGINLWVDEPIVSRGGTSIETAIGAATVATNTICSGNTLDGNTFYTGHIWLGNNSVTIDSICNNRFAHGLIVINSANQDNLVVMGNSARSNDMVSEKYYHITVPTFICLTAAHVNNTRIDNNATSAASGYCVSLSGAGSDGGNNSFMNNRNMSTTALADLSFLPVATSPCTIFAAHFPVAPKVIGSISAGKCTYTQSSGVFSRVGNEVSFQIFLSWTEHNGTGNIFITGLPYATSTGVNGYGVANVYFDSIKFIGLPTCQLSANDNIVYPGTITSGAGFSFLQMSTIGQIRVSGKYLLNI